mmetsp:Transcript_1443/g.4000  ORF Transcript_1443/g.4000 Transcript_1443/m.4000 type:complete len:349 (-) Transcript_1443:2036-3082(-)
MEKSDPILIYSTYLLLSEPPLPALHGRHRFQQPPEHRGIAPVEFFHQRLRRRTASRPHPSPHPHEVPHTSRESRLPVATATAGATTTLARWTGFCRCRHYPRSAGSDLRPPSLQVGQERPGRGRPAVPRRRGPGRRGPAEGRFVVRGGRGRQSSPRPVIIRSRRCRGRRQRPPSPPAEARAPASASAAPPEPAGRQRRGPRRSGPRGRKLLPPVASGPGSALPQVPRGAVRRIPGLLLHLLRRDAALLLGRGGLHEVVIEHPREAFAPQDHLQSVLVVLFAPFVGVGGGGISSSVVARVGRGRRRSRGSDSSVGIDHSPPPGNLSCLGHTLPSPRDAPPVGLECEKIP